MGADRPRRARRARSLTARIAGASVIVLASFLGVVSATIDALERGGTIALVILFSSIVALAVLIGFAVARAHARTLADLIAAGAPRTRYPRDARVVADAVRDVRAPDAPTAPAPDASVAIDPPQQQSAVAAGDRLRDLLDELRRQRVADGPTEHDDDIRSGPA